ncbi:MAG: hypothetical protein LBR16_01395 [Treponema sp.]|jgi:hypothetical protein|nr:hypothetical protein [Treponema sp.]
MNMTTKKTALLCCAALALSLAFSACEWEIKVTEDTSKATWSAWPVDGAHWTADTNAIKFTFTKPVKGLNLSDIDVAPGVEADIGSVTSVTEVETSGNATDGYTEWKVGITHKNTNVENRKDQCYEGLLKVTIDKDGVESNYHGVPFFEEKYRYNYTVTLDAGVVYPLTGSSVTKGSGDDVTTEIIVTFDTDGIGIDPWISAEDIQFLSSSMVADAVPVDFIVIDTTRSVESNDGEIFHIPVKVLKPSGDVYIYIDKVGIVKAINTTKLTVWGDLITFEIEEPDPNVTTTGLTFTFSAEIDKFPAFESASGLARTIGGTGAITLGDASGYGAVWYLPITVTTAGNVTFTANDNETYSGNASVTVYKRKATWSVEAAQGSDSATTTSLTFTVSDDKTIDHDKVILTGAAEKNPEGASTGNTLDVITDYTGNVIVEYEGDGYIEAGEAYVYVYKKLITFTGSANGSDQTNTSLITLNFTEDITSLPYNSVTVRGGAVKSGEAITGSGTSWSIPVTPVSTGTAYVIVYGEGISSSPVSVSGIHQYTPPPAPPPPPQFLLSAGSADSTHPSKLTSASLPTVYVNAGGSTGWKVEISALYGETSQGMVTQTTPVVGTKANYEVRIAALSSWTSEALADGLSWVVAGGNPTWVNENYLAWTITNSNDRKKVGGGKYVIRVRAKNPDKNVYSGDWSPWLYFTNNGAGY